MAKLLSSVASKHVHSHWMSLRGQPNILRTFSFHLSVSWQIFHWVLPLFLPVRNTPEFCCQYWSRLDVFDSKSYYAR